MVVWTFSANRTTDDTIDADGPPERRKNSGDKRDDSTSHKDMAYTWSRNLVPKDNVATWPRAIRAHVVKAICVTAVDRSCEAVSEVFELHNKLALALSIQSQTQVHRHLVDLELQWQEAQQAWPPSAQGGRRWAKLASLHAHWN